MLKKAFIGFLDTISPLFPLGLLKTLSRQHALLPFYHIISDTEVPHVKHLYHVKTTKDFVRDLDYLLKYYQPIGLDELIQSVNEEKSVPRNALFLSFDDGLAECYHIIAPILKKKGIPATFFLNSDFIDNKALMFRYKASLLIEHISINPDIISSGQCSAFENHGLNATNFKKELRRIRWHQQGLLNELAAATGLDFDAYLKKNTPYMNSNQIKELISWGFDMGSHSLNHPRYKDLKPTEQIHQTLVCHKILESQFKLSSKTFAFPFTDDGVKRSFFDEIINKEGFDLTLGGAGIKHEQIERHKQRIGLESRQKRNCKQIIHSEHIYYILKALFRKNTIHRT